MSDQKALVLIPARFASSRFPGKPLVPLLGTPMIQRVYQNCEKLTEMGLEADICVVTDDDRIEQAVLSFGGKVVRVDDDVVSGSIRIALAYERFFKAQGKYDLIINVQGDEPLLQAQTLIDLAKFHRQSQFDITTVVRPMGTCDSFTDPNRVKAIVTPKEGRCLYFSRSPIPHVRQGEQDNWDLHIGVYSYRPEALIEFAGGELGHFEQLECLEQLRALEMGQTIGAIKTEMQLFGVDEPDDVLKLEELLKNEMDK